MVLIGSGLRDLDLLLGGGFIRDSPVLLLTETGTMGELLPLQIINHRVQEGDYGFILDLDFPPVRIREWFKFFNWDLERFERDGRLFIVDGFTNLYGKLPTDETHVIENPRDIVHLDAYFYDLRVLIEKFEKEVFGVLYLSNMFLTKGRHLDKIINLIYKTRIALSQYGASIFVFDRGMMDRTALNTLEHAFDYVIELRVVEHEKRFQKYLRVTKSPLINYVDNLVPYEVVPSGVLLRTELFREFDSIKHTTKMPEDGVIDFMDIRAAGIPAEVIPLIFKTLMDKYGYETGYRLTHAIGKEVGRLLARKFKDKFKVFSIEESVPFFTKTATLMGMGEFTVKEYDEEKGIIKFQVTNSPECAFFKDTAKKTGPLIGGAIEGVGEFYLGLGARCEEVKCVSKGDDCCEYVLTFSPKRNKESVGRESSVKT